VCCWLGSGRLLRVSGVPWLPECCRELGFDTVEVNASDTRNKADSKRKDGIAGKTSNRMKELVTNSAIGATDGKTNTRRQVLIMDEVDGMSGTAAVAREERFVVACSVSVS
jgi:hypothetical protein